mmetsp:Transcript_44911/g.73214  ORF Transcript_44911/g.73214 Transcript_44911/m.73214 type:complete len:452 (-) Transcript_44911:145-1500(-)
MGSGASTDLILIDEDGYELKVKPPGTGKPRPTVQHQITASSVDLKIGEKAPSTGSPKGRGNTTTNADAMKPKKGGMSEERKRALKAKIMKSRHLGYAANAFSDAGKQLGIARGQATSERHPWLLRAAPVSSAATRPEHFEFKVVVGTGLFGHVWLARYKKYQGYLAVKQMGKARLASQVRRAREEKEAMQALGGHPFIARLFGTFQCPTDVYFVMEYLPGGELFSRIAGARRGRLSVEAAKFYALETFSALEHIHAKGFVYRDLKPENIVLDEDGHARLVDFGFCRRPDPGTGRCASSVGTPAYQSPELLNGKFTGGYGAAVDWWAFGCLVYEMLLSRTPFEGKTRKETPYQIYARVLKGKVNFPRRFPGYLKETLKALFEVDYEKRFKDAQSVKSTPMLNRTDWKAVIECRLIPPFVPELLLEADSHYFDECPLPRTAQLPDDQAIFEGF